MARIRTFLITIALSIAHISTHAAGYAAVVPNASLMGMGAGEASLTSYYRPDFNAPTFAPADDGPVTGIDCECDKTGDYRNANSGKAPTTVAGEAVEPQIDLVSGTDGLSPNGTYRLTVAGNASTGYTATVRKDGASTSLVSTPVISDMKWGFSPDDHRFVTWHMDGNNLVVNLYDLQKSSNRHVKTYYGAVYGAVSGSSAAIAFSPKGGNLLVSTVSGTNTTQVTVINKDGGERVSMQVTGEAGWQFSPDDRRFVLWRVSGNIQTTDVYTLTPQPAVRVRTMTHSLYTGSEGQKSTVRFSPNGRYVLVAALGSATAMNVEVVDTTGAYKIRKQFGASISWGFSPDDHRFATWTLQASTQTTDLYDLTGRENNLVKSHSVTLYTAAQGESSRVRFSNNGQYMLVASIVGQLSTRLNVIHKSGAMAHDATFSHSAIVDTTNSYGGAAWGFSPDKQDRTLLYAWNTGQTGLEWRLVNLETQEVVQRVSETGATAAFWQFSPCGDAAALVVQPNQTSANVHLYATRAGALMGSKTVSVSAINLASTASSHLVSSGSGTQTLAANTAGGSCTIELITLKSLVLDPDTLVGGELSTATVTLTGTAPSGGVVVNIEANSSLLDLPETVTVVAGKSSTTFDIETEPTTTWKTVILSAIHGETVKKDTLVITPPVLEEMWVRGDEELPAGVDVEVGAGLSGSALAGGAKIILTSSNPSVLAVPATLQIPEGESSAYTTVQPARVSGPVQVILTAALDGIKKSVEVTVRPGRLVDFGPSADALCSVTRADATGPEYVSGRAITMEVQFDGLPAPGGATVTLTSSSSAQAALPASVTVDTLVAYVDVTTQRITAPVSVDLTADTEDDSFSYGFTLVPAPVLFDVMEIMPPTGFIGIRTYALNNLGQVVGGGGDGTMYRSVLWENGAVTAMTPQQAPTISLTDVNDFGEAVGNRLVDGERQGVIWRDGRIIPLYEDDETYFEADAINNDGVVAGKFYDKAANKYNAAVWNKGKLDVLPVHPGYPISWATDINDAGTVVGVMGLNFQLNAPLYLGFMWKPDEEYFATVAGGDFRNSTGVHAINEAGRMVGESPYHGGYTALGIWEGRDRRSDLSFARIDGDAVNNRGDVVGQIHRSGELVSLPSLAMYMRDNVVYDLNCLVSGDVDLVFGRTIDINDAGQILAEGRRGGETVVDALLTPHSTGPAADLAVAVDADRETVSAGSLFQYSMSVSNVGSQPAQLVRLSTQLGADSIFVAHTASEGTCTRAGSLLKCDIGTLAAGASAAISITVKPKRAGTLEYGAVVSSMSLDSTPANNKAYGSVQVTGEGNEGEDEGIEVPAGFAGVIEEQDMGILIEFTDASDTAGRLAASRFKTPFEGENGITPIEVETGLGLVTPDTLYHASFWAVTDTGLTAYTCTVCVDVSNLPESLNVDGLVVLKRSASGEPWKPLETVRRTVGEKTYICAAGLQSFGQFAIGWERVDEIPTSNEDESGPPTELVLEDAYPNPAAGPVTIAYALPRAGHVELSVYNMLGQRVEKLVDGPHSVGRYTVGFNGRDFASGIYIYAIRFDGELRTGKMVVAR